jgi:hypothetical protein
MTGRLTNSAVALALAVMAMAVYLVFARLNGPPGVGWAFGVTDAAAPGEGNRLLPHGEQHYIFLEPLHARTGTRVESK